MLQRVVGQSGRGTVFHHFEGSWAGLRPPSFRDACVTQLPDGPTAPARCLTQSLSQEIDRGLPGTGQCSIAHVRSFRVNEVQPSDMLATPRSFEGADDRCSWQGLESRACRHD
jgi:hypothetical protein